MDTKDLITEDVVDIPSDRDYLFGEYLEEENAEGNKGIRPEEYFNVLDQGSKPMCTNFAMWAIVNGNKILEDLKEMGEVVRNQYDPNIDGVDDIRSLQARIDKFKKEGLIEGYLSIPRVGWKTPTGVMTVERRNMELKTALDKGFFVYTGTEYSKWTMYQSPILNLQDNRYTGHAFSIVGADDIYHSTSNLYKFVNSFGKEWGNDGYGYIKDFNVDKLFTCYVVIPKSNSDFFKKFKANKKIMEFIITAKKIYEENKDNKDIRDYFEKIQLTNNLTKLFKL